VLSFERKYWDLGKRMVAGVDEAGRGPLAGPVVAAAVTIEPDWALRQQDDLLSGLTDSKQLSRRQRELFFDRLMDAGDAVAVGVGVAEAPEIDALNILRATHAAMARALNALPVLPDVALVDGLPVGGLPCPSEAIVRGDACSLLIAAASIVAKVTRDARMRELDDEYPAYGFARNKGYGTRAHVEALYREGPCPEHRHTFAPVRDAELNRQGPRQGELFG
jgi:ribonuclease HII